MLNCRGENITIVRFFKRLTMNNITTNPQIKLFSFFAGGGFLDLGFESQNFQTAFVNEIHEPFLDAYIHAREKLKIKPPIYGVSNADISTLLNDKKLKKSVFGEEKIGNITGFIGGPPCPDFSVAGKNRGETGENGKLSETYIDLICSRKPHFFLFENVKGLYRTKKHRAFFEHLKAKLSQHYHLNEKLINSIEYGAPQDRDRIILIGFRRDSFPSIKMDWLKRIYPDQKAFQYEWPGMATFHPRKEVKRPLNVPLELTVQYWFDKNDVENHPNAKDHFTPRAGLSKFKVIDEGDDKKKSYKRLHRWRYSPTVAYGNNEVHLHPYKARRISASEALAIQSLPKEYEFLTKMTLSNMFKCIGNGVPFLVAQGLAFSIESYIRRNYETHSKQFSNRN